MSLYEDEEVVDTEETPRRGAFNLSILEEDEEEELTEGRSLWEIGFERGEEKAREEILSEGDLYE